MKLTAFLLLPLLFATPARAEDQNVIKVENGVTVKSGSSGPVQPFSPEVTKSGNVKNDFFDPRVAPNSPTAPSVDLPTVTPPKKPASSAETLKMKPIISPNSPGASGEKPKAPKKPAKTEAPEKPSEKTEEVKSPFKKSQDANVTETVKKPEPKPEVKSATLPGSVAGKTDNGDILHEIEKIDKMGNEKPVTTPELPLSAIIGTAKNAAKTDDELTGPGQTLSATGETGLPVPRFVTFKSGEVNARTGPGENYPIRWLYQRKNLPVEITAEFKLWRRIKDFDGEQSWVHHAMVSSRRYGIISRDVTLKSEADGGSKIANLKRGVQVKINECKESACEVQYGKLEGWAPKKSLWGVYEKEVFH